MDPATPIRAALELLIVAAVGGMLISALGRLRRGQITPYRCRSCDRPTTRANPRCRHCGAAVGDPS